MLAGARSLTEATEWIADAPHWVLLALGFSIDPFSKTVTVPHPTRVMRLLGRLDGDALDAAVSEFLQTRGESVQSGRRLRAVSVDGKVLRSSRSAGGKAAWLPAAMDRTGTVLGQSKIDDKSNETPAFIPVLTGINLQNMVITADAAHTQHANGTWLREHNAHYIAIVKANHPGLLGRLKKPPWRDIPLNHYEQSSGHHRIEIRRLKAVVFRHLDYPGACQALQVVRWRKDLTSKKISIQRLYFVTSLPAGAASGAELAGWIRSHWKIENQLHHVRDTTFTEDAPRIRSGGPLRTMATLRNLAISVFRQDGRTNIAAACRHTARAPQRPLTALGIT